ncbi:MAG: hypothetical protein JNL72_13460 [Flavipsychrobacter sp.]|nr:hypothetical protein [Flavipsychrobacter sp.]
MKILPSIAIAALIAGSATLMSFDDKNNQGSPCAILKSGSYKIGDAADTTAYIVFTSSSQTEYYNFKRHTIRSSIKWLSDCEFEVTALSVNYPGLICKRGETMSIRILNVEGDIVNYEALVDGRRERGRYIKMTN